MTLIFIESHTHTSAAVSLAFLSSLTHVHVNLVLQRLAGAVPAAICHSLDAKEDRLDRAGKGGCALEQDAEMHASGRFEVFGFNVKAFVGHNALVEGYLDHLQGRHFRKCIRESLLRFLFCN